MVSNSQTLEIASLNCFATARGERGIEGAAWRVQSHQSCDGPNPSVLGVRTVLAPSRSGLSVESYFGLDVKELGNQSAGVRLQPHLLAKRGKERPSCMELLNC